MASKAVVGMTILLALSACGAPPTRRDGAGADAAKALPPAAGAPSGVPPASSQPNHWTIDPARSELRVLVHRAGPMALLGHNHVLINHGLTGWAQPADGAGAAAFFLEIRSADFVVDDAAARAAAGADFAAAVDDEAKAGTRSNLLGGGVLDAERFPTITLRSLSAMPAGAAAPVPAGPDSSAAPWVATVAARVAGHASTIHIPFTLQLAGGRAIGSGTTALRQSDLGLTPFSVMLGALQVQDEITVEFVFTAVANDQKPS